ncbi:hypothetical protein E4T66_17495 [Sinimarinibacterium sp. CAU 1509]|uniref:hypothetical protein n=1 Tax=Sinimarinibacterium sp. CAU 1509 TaxID=2562283 RepID=UPI0010AB5791|nr:hypothetical protein [Sinimarinibacterium sp. CAU 1509]TJY57204.1 hypothetical protein E4T66_17495 [Sinimarinibacterium sp. CAU 1509]
MNALSTQAAVQVYQLVQIPLSRQVSINVPATSLEEVRAWAIENVDTTTRWIVMLDGRNLGNAIVVRQYAFDTSTGKVVARTFNSTARRIGHFSTPEEALADYRSHLAEASQRLDVIERRFAELKNELAFDLAYSIAGDTHGIDEEYLFISVSIGGYQYRRQI